ncbi:D-lactate dehydrogenase [Bartonella sp. HY038]|uniref:D-lactate dehydrogenase n=1 Tax=Bartonella sp. HY038 TaxID=2759660 RepID=UPI0015F85207|nr:D-lactate dehydrogenase [Bartonella sp. HY038]
MTDNSVIASIKGIVGEKHCLTDANQTERYRKGFRSGEGDAKLVIIPGSLTELWQCLKILVTNDFIIIMQASNTGLTEGSTPKGSYERDVAIISTLRLDHIYVLDEGKQIISQPGGTLYKLEDILSSFNREPHSVIGSSCIGASIIGGICNNSGGALVKRGPAYTELSLYAQIDEKGELQLVNHLGIDLGETAEEILTKLDNKVIDPAWVSYDVGAASNHEYSQKVREVDAATPARFNADPSGLFEAAGSAGKIAVFAVRLDSFAKEENSKIYYIGTNDTNDLTVLRRRMLSEFDELPISGEYMHRDCFDISHKYGKDTLLMIHKLGTKRLPGFFAFKKSLDTRLEHLSFLPVNLSDRMIQLATQLVPDVMPKRMLDYRNQYEHHLILKVSSKLAQQTEALLNETVGSGWFLCDADEGKKAMLNRFVAAGAVIRYALVHPKTSEDVLALDIALRRNDDDWFERLPPEIDAQIEQKAYYGHFFCHVLHQDYVVKKGVDVKALKAKMLEVLDKRGAEYPAEHNVGHLYKAKPALANHYMKLDPTNSFNPGIGKTDKTRFYAACCPDCDPSFKAEKVN